MIDPANSPFPGMNPYLEQHWGDVHASLTTYARDALQPQLPHGLVARMEEYVVLEDDSLLWRVRPDVIAEGPPSQGDREAGATATMVQETVDAAGGSQPLIVYVEEPPTLRTVQIRETATGRLITAIEFISPANKRGAAAADFREKQARLLAAGVNVVEVDLVRRGRFIMSAPESLFPPPYLHPYRVCVLRATNLRRAELYQAVFRAPLPTVNVPLRASDADVQLPLQQLLINVYSRGAYDRTDYTVDPDPPLDAADAAWADELLRNTGRRRAN